MDVNIDFFVFLKFVAVLDGVRHGLVHRDRNFVVQVGFIVSHQFRVGDDVMRDAFNEFQLTGNFDMNRAFGEGVEFRVFKENFPLFRGAPHDRQNFLGIRRFMQEVIGAEIQGFDGRVHVRVACQHHDNRVPVQRADFFEQVQPAHARHHYVGHHNVERTIFRHRLPEKFQPRFPVIGDNHLIIFRLQ